MRLARRVRPGRQPHPARPGALRRPSSSAAPYCFARSASTTSVSCATCSATRTTGALRGHRAAGLPVRRELGQARRRGRDRARRPARVRRRVVPALHGGRARLRLRRRADARADDRRRAVAPRQGRRRELLQALLERARQTATPGQPERAGGPDGASTSATASTSSSTTPDAVTARTMRRLASHRVRSYENEGDQHGR